MGCRCCRSSCGGQVNVQYAFTIACNTKSVTIRRRANLFECSGRFSTCLNSKALENALRYIRSTAERWITVGCCRSFSCWSSCGGQRRTCSMASPRRSAETCSVVLCNVCSTTEWWITAESQLPHKIINILFTITNSNIQLTFLGGVDFGWGVCAAVPLASDKGGRSR